MDEPCTSVMADEHSCILCEKLGSSSKTNSDLGEIIKISRGVTTLRAASSERQDGLLPHLQTEFVYAHASCRQKYMNKKYIEIYKKKQNETSCSPPKKKLRSSTDLLNFDWEKNCVFCGQEADKAKEAKLNKNRRRQISYINTATFSDSLVNFIAVQKNDYYREIHKRIAGITDLQTLEAKYHFDCYNSIKNSINLINVEKKISPRIVMIDTAMEQIYKYIEENDDCQFTMQELKNVITTEHIPDEKTIRKRLIDRYHDDIVISTKFGSNTIICFKKMNHDILTENWYNQIHNNKKDAEFHILKAASEIIRRDIRAQVYDKENYTASDKMLEDIDKSIPQSLKFLLSEIILKDKKNRVDTIPAYEKKSKSIAHAVISAVRPRSFLSPLHITLAVMFHRKFGSKKVINICHSLGFCASYKEATLYEASATFASPPEIKPGSFIQFVHDNADFNINTIDGKGTFHYMGSIEIVTPADGIQPRRSIKRLKTIPPESEFVEKGNIPLQIYPASVGTGFSNITIKLSEFEPDIKKFTTNGQLNILWTYFQE